jgi:hypothetical protein
VQGASSLTFAPSASFLRGLLFEGLGVEHSPY